jgi:hypothetical protein
MAGLESSAAMAAVDVCLEPNFELEAMAVKEGHIIKNLKRRYFRLVGDSSSPSNRSLFLYYGSSKQEASKSVDLVGAKIADQTESLGNFSSEHVCCLHLDKQRNGNVGYFALCFDTPALCSEWKTCIHSFNTASSSSAEIRDLLSLIQDSWEKGNLPSRPLATLRNNCMRNPAFRSALTTSEAGLATVIALLQHEDADIQLNAISIVAACCDSLHRTQTFQTSGALTLLLRCSQDHSGSRSDGRNPEAALVAIAQMCSVSASCQDFLKDVAGLNLFLKVMSLMKTKRQDSLMLKKLVRKVFNVRWSCMHVSHTV